MIRNVLNKLGSLRSALAVGLGVPFLIASSAFAQVENSAIVPGAALNDPAGAPTAPGATAGATATTDRVVVTGSYIPTAETESALPVTVYTAEVLQKQGANTPAEGLRQLPSFVGNTATENDSNGGDGSAFINLRALGSGNTLTLVNGRRAFAFADINGIGLGSLSRSEVLKDGASAIYGSDAVAGVVNFILLNGPGEAPYEGAEVDFLYGNTTDKDARVLQGYVRGGVATEKVSIAAAATYYDVEGIFSRDRDISASTDTRINGTLGLGGRNTGSPTFPGALSVGSGIPGPGATPFPASARGARIIINPNGFPDGTDPNRGYRAYLGGNSNDPFNFRQFTPAIPPRETYTTYVTGRYKIFGEGLQLYGDMMYAKRKQDNGLAPAPFAFSNTRNGLTEARNSPFNPFGNSLTLLRYRLINELSLRRSFFDYDYYRYTVGINGNFTFTGNNFISFLGYDTGMVYSRDDELRIDSGDAQRTPLRAETAAGNFNPFIGLGTPVQGTAPTFVNGVPTGARAPYDNVAAVGRAAFIARSDFFAKNFLADVKVFGNLLPNLYQGGIGFNLGYEFRHARTKTIPDTVQAAGDQLGFNAAANNSFHQEVNSYFGELQVPLVISTMNIPFVRSLDASVAYRYEEFDNKDQFTKRTSEFNNNGDVRVSLRYAPIQDILLRATFGESFRSPSPTALFDPVQQNFPSLFDPFPTVNGVQGVTLQPTNGVQQGGNVALRPETTEAYTAGIVITPRFLPGFTMTADLYQLFTRNVILNSADFAQLALTQTGNFLVNAVGGGDPSRAPFGSAPFAGVIQRNPSSPFEVQSIDAQSQNAGKRLVNGLDVTAAYRIPTTNFGTFTLSSGYNYFFTWKAEPVPGAGTHSFLGDYNNGTLPLAPGALPYHKGFLRGEHEWKGFDFVATMNYISSFNDDSNFVLFANGLTVTQTGGTDTDPQFNTYRRVSDYITLDMQLSYEFVKPAMEPVMAAGKDFSKDGKSMAPAPVAGVETGNVFQRLLWGTTLRVGVNNAFDRNPPTVLGAFNDNYDTSNYSLRNRYYYVGINKKF